MSDDVLTPPQIRGRVVEAILAGMSEWNPSPWPYALVGMDQRAWLHKSFAVGLLDTQIVDPRRPTTHRSPQVPVQYVRAETGISIRLMYRIRLDAMNDDIDIAGFEEGNVITALTQNYDATGIGPYLPERVSRRVVGDGTYSMTQIDLSFHHMFRIS